MITLSGTELVIYCTMKLSILKVNTGVNRDVMKLLLIEDDRPSLKALAATLRMLGFDSEAFSDPEEAIARFRSRHDFDVVITDLRMPRISGAEVLDKIRNLSPQMPVILITAYRDHVPSHANRVFCKPIDIQALVEYLNLLKNKERCQVRSKAGKNK